MKGDFTAIRRWPFKHYTSVRMQQGRVQLDTDWNDQVELQNHLDRSETVDVIGSAGGPKGPDGGFRIDRTPDGKDLTISPGRFWADGLLCELSGGASYLDQPDLPAPPFVTSGALTLPDGTYLAYLDVWERLVTVLEDPDIREPALRGADTTTRTQVVWQLKLLPVADPNGTGTCDTAFPEWPPAAPAGKVSARATVPSTGTDRCTVEATGGYRRLENQLYRVEIHAGGTRASGATFKWSRENGSVVASWTQLTGDVLGVSSPGRDRVLGFAVGDWVELTDDDRERTQKPGVLVKLSQVADTALTIDPTTFDPPGTVLSYGDFRSNPKVRRWEADLPSAASAARPLLPNPAGDGFIDLEDGVQVKFEDGDYRTGDYWVVPARTVLGDVIWPVDPVTKLPVPEPPLGVEHHYARLAVIRKAGANLNVTSCYPQFPPLTDIAASDVSFDNTSCSFSPAATTVQEAIDDLCRRSGGGCHLVVAAGTDLQAFFDGLAQQNLTSVAVCLTVGTWNLDKAVLVKLSGDVVVKGSGPATRLVAAKSETALEFLGCSSAAVSDLFVQTGVTGTKAIDPASQHLNGSLQFQGCGAVTVERVGAQCGAGIERAAACIAVRPDPARPAPTRVRLRSCDLSVGHRQVGILLVNASRAQVEDNAISVLPRPGNLGVLNGLRQNKAYRAMLRKRLFSGVTVAADSAAARVKAAQRAGAGTLALSLGGHLVTLQTQGPVLGALRDTITSVATKLGAPTEIVDLGAIATQIRVLRAAPGAAPAPHVAPAPPGGAAPAPGVAVPPAGPAAPSPTGGAPAPGTGVAVPPGGVTRLDPAVLKSLESFAGARMPADNVLKAMRNVVTSRVIRQRIHQIAKEVLLASGGANFKNWFGSLVAGSPASAYQGITVVGTQADEVRLKDNTISGVLQGIHVAVSQPGTQRLQGGNLWIEDNTIQVIQPQDFKGERHGIFVGNFQSLVIQGNHLSLQRLGINDAIDGIRIYGLLGPRVVVENNFIDQFTRSIWVHPLNPADAPHALWLVSRNACSHASVTVVPENGVQTGDLNIG
ncbi:MAG TPA: DUF6519 domain-containing protein [Vicinamibacteria bacterium]|nr:DUF6519 domain-containing protein [Vicinamibacteria bacterium]